MFGISAESFARLKVAMRNNSRHHEKRQLVVVASAMLTSSPELQSELVVDASARTCHDDFLIQGHKASGYKTAVHAGA